MSSNSHQIVININKAAQIDIPMAIQKGLERACLGIERAAKDNLNGHTQSGNLRSSISHRVQGNEGVVFANEPYAPYVEAGTGVYATEGSKAKKIPWSYCDAAGNWHTTSGMQAVHFLKQARDNNLSAIIKCFEGLL